MSSTQPSIIRPASNLLIVGTFIAAFTGMAIIVSFLPFENSAMGLFAVIGAAGVAAQVWFSREKTVPASGRVWQISVICGILSGILSSAFALLVLSLDDEIRREISGVSTPPLLPSSWRSSR